jgi:hypothetical protein
MAILQNLLPWVNHEPDYIDPVDRLEVAAVATLLVTVGFQYGLK